jgi:hypothetical protein
MALSVSTDCFLPALGFVHHHAQPRVAAPTNFFNLQKVPKTVTSLSFSLSMRGKLVD